LLIAVTLLLQRGLGVPGGPEFLSLLVLPMVWVVGPALLDNSRRWVWIALVMGLTWDVLLEPIVGPGGIAWSAAALVVVRLATFVADRSSKAWFAFGAVGTAVVLLVHRLVLMLLGGHEPWRWIDLASSVGVTALWCGLVGWILALDLPTRWRAYRARKLR
jgi:hypothetical protein